MSQYTGPCLTRLRGVPHFSPGIVERAKRERFGKSTRARKGDTRRGERKISPWRVSPFLAWVDFHARSRFARSTIPEEKWGTTRSLMPDKILTVVHDVRSWKVLHVKPSIWRPASFPGISLTSHWEQRCLAQNMPNFRHIRAMRPWLYPSWFLICATSTVLVWERLFFTKQHYHAIMPRLTSKERRSRNGYKPSQEPVNLLCRRLSQSRKTLRFK